MYRHFSELLSLPHGVDWFHLFIWVIRLLDTLAQSIANVLHKCKITLIQN